MTSYRWTNHRVVDASGTDASGPAAISMWWLARAAAEETMQGSPLAAAWLKLFRTQLSERDPDWLRWRGDLAESAELRRAYSGLYGRFTARALLKEHLGLSRFLSLKRNGISVAGAVDVVRLTRGDIPDWLAWDDRKSTYVLCEAKGSLTATDFLANGTPKCVREGKKQFDRVSTLEAGVLVLPDRWVAATRWATDQRRGDPVTILWDPPVPDDPDRELKAAARRTAMTKAWLESLAPSLGYRSAAELTSNERGREALIVKAGPGEATSDLAWPTDDGPKFEGEADLRTRRIPAAKSPNVAQRTYETLRSNLLQSKVYGDGAVLRPRGPETHAHEQAYVAAAITQFGIRPIQTLQDFEVLRRDQDRARRLEAPVMLVGIPTKLDPSVPPERRPWMASAGIAQAGELAVFDLRLIEVMRTKAET